MKALQKKTRVRKILKINKYQIYKPDPSTELPVGKAGLSPIAARKFSFLTTGKLIVGHKYLPSVNYFGF